MRVLAPSTLVLVLAALIIPAADAVPDRALRYYAANGNVVFDAGDTLYRVQCLPDVDWGPSDAVRPGWLRLTSFGSFGPGTIVKPGDPDLNLLVITPGPLLP